MKARQCDYCKGFAVEEVSGWLHVIGLLYGQPSTRAGGREWDFCTPQCMGAAATAHLAWVDERFPLRSVTVS